MKCWQPLISEFLRANVHVALFSGVTSCRNPLHALLGSAQFLEEQSGHHDAASSCDDLKTIISCAKQMSTIIASMSDWLDANSAGVDVKRQAVDVAALCKDSVRSWLQAASSSSSPLPELRGLPSLYLALACGVVAV